jgi:hypothetical protein
MRVSTFGQVKRAATRPIGQPLLRCGLSRQRSPKLRPGQPPGLLYCSRGSQIAASWHAGEPGTSKNRQARRGAAASDAEAAQQLQFIAEKLSVGVLLFQVQGSPLEAMGVSARLLAASLIDWLSTRTDKRPEALAGRIHKTAGCRLTRERTTARQLVTPSRALNQGSVIVTCGPERTP